MTIHSGTPLPDNDDDNAMQLASVPARENFPLHHWAGGGGHELFSDLESCALLGGSGACPTENFFKMVQFGVHFDQILSLKKF